MGAKRALFEAGIIQRRPTRPLSKAVAHSYGVLAQGAQLCLVQSLRDVRDQIGWVFDADRQPDRGVENTYFLAGVSRNAGVRHAGRQAGKRLGAAQTHRQLQDLQRVQELERCGLAADNVERKRGARARALLSEQTTGGGGLIVVSKVMDLRDLGVVAQVIRHEPRVSVSFFHADAQCFERPAEHPTGMEVQLSGSAQRFEVFHEGFWAERGARNEPQGAQ